MKTEYNLGLFDLENDKIRIIKITEAEYNALMRYWEKPLKCAIAIGEPHKTEEGICKDENLWR